MMLGKLVCMVSLLVSAAAATPTPATFEEWKATQTEQDVFRLQAGWEAYRIALTNVPPTTEELAAREAALQAEWVTSTEYAARVQATMLVQGIRAVLASKNIQPRSREQVFADVSAWVDAQEDQLTALKTSVKLMAAYSNLESLTGDVRGLISGERVVSLDRSQPIVVEAP